jgi:hypothetical protein
LVSAIVLIQIRPAGAGLDLFPTQTASARQCNGMRQQSGG